MDVASPTEAEPTPHGVNWGSLIWPGGRPTGDAQVLADRAAAAAAIAARAEDPDDQPTDDGTDGPPHVRDLAAFTGLVRQRPMMVRTYPEAEPVAVPAFEPWNPEATYESLVLLLTELKAMHPNEVAVLPTKPSRHGAVRRRGRLIAGVAAAAVAVSGVGALVVTHKSAHHSAAVVAAPHMSTLLIAIESGNVLQGATLLAREGNKTQEILVPSRLLVDVPGQGSAQLSEAPVSGANATAEAIANALQVRVDGTWVLTPASLAALVDAVGGVDVTLTDDVLPTDGSVTLNLGVGTSHITGAQAGPLALAIGSQEPEASRLARQQLLLEAILTKLPTDQTQLTAVLQNAQLAGNIAVPSLATLVGGVRDDVAAQRAVSIVVPTNEIDSGSGTPSYGLDEKAAAAMVADRLALAEFPVPAGGRARILVQNGIGTPGLGDVARADLVPRGYIFRGGGNVAAFGAGTSVVLIPDGTAPSRALGTTIAQLLGLPASAVQLDSAQTTIADVVVILGSDFRAPATAQAPATP
ncbi:MAG: LCP family protein [Actinomycetota bacterium]|nr:LCP family protein [Actinomycetota bacterium]